MVLRKLFTLLRRVFEMNAQCSNPRCGSFKTESGKDFLANDMKCLLVGGILSCGIVLVFWLPYMAIRSSRGYYNPANHYCYNCENKWAVSHSRVQKWQ